MSQEIIPRKLHVSFWITNEYVKCNFGKLNPEKYVYATEMTFCGKLIPKTDIYVCNLFWLECIGPDFPTIERTVRPPSFDKALHDAAICSHYIGTNNFFEVTFDLQSFGVGGVGAWNR